VLLLLLSLSLIGYSTKSVNYNSVWVSVHADPKPGYDNLCYYAIQITASQFLDKIAMLLLAQKPVHHHRGSQSASGHISSLYRMITVSGVS